MGSGPAAGTVVEVGSVLNRLLSADRLADVTDRQRLSLTPVSRQTDTCYRQASPLRMKKSVQDIGFSAKWTVSARLTLQQQSFHHREEAVLTATLLLSKSSCGVDRLGTNLNLSC